MTLRTVEPEEVKFFQHGVEYAMASGTFDIANIDHLENLRNLRKILVGKRRALALDVAQYPQSCIGRALDIQKIMPVIRAIDEAIADEELLAKLGL